MEISNNLDNCYATLSIRLTDYLNVKINNKFKQTHQISEHFLLGWEIRAQEQFGFANRTMPERNPKLITSQGEGHLMTIGKTGSGKSRNVVIPNLLNSRFSKIVLDIKGELYLTTSRHHRLQNYHTILIDPFHYLTNSPDLFNPFDIIQFVSEEEYDTECQNLAEMIAINHSSKEPFWDISATGLLASVISYITSVKPVAERNIGSVIELLMSDDVSYNLALILDTMDKKLSKMAYREIAGFLQTAEVTRGGILPTAHSYLKAFNNERICQSFLSTSFDLKNLITNLEPFIIYFVIPPTYVQSHASLIRLCFYALMKIFTKRREIPEIQTVFFLDEIAQFGNGFKILETIMTIGRGYGLNVWLFLQSLNQLQQNYPKSWRTMVENTSVIQVFQPNSLMTAKEIESLTGLSAYEVLQIKSNEQYIIQNSRPQKAIKIDYLTDAMFAGKFSLNPYYTHQKLEETQAGFS